MNKQERAVNEEMVQRIVRELAIYCVLADSGEAERRAAECVRAAIREAEYDAVHGTGAHFRAFLHACKAEVASWPTWKRGEASGEGRTSSTPPIPPAAEPRD